MTGSVLITGAAGGIGLALCQAFLDQGRTVIALDLEDRLAALDPHDQLRTLGFDLRQLATEPSGAARLKSLCDALGAPPIDLLINNAAVQHLAPTSGITHDQWSETLAVNVTAPLRLVQTFLETLTCVINISSVHARASKLQFASYATSKAALDGLTRSLALDLAPKTRVVGLAPAAVSTAMLEAGFAQDPGARDCLDEAHPTSRIADPQEIARAAVFLAGADASFMTGQTLTLDGGILSKLCDPAW